LRCRTLAVIGAVALACMPSPAHAFDVAAQFFDNQALPHAATLGASGEGVYFTGAPRFASRNCADCHVGGPQRVGLRLNADDQSLFTGGYQPGRTYQLQVALTDEAAGTKYHTPTCTDPPLVGDTFTYVQCNNNSFALEIDAAGAPLAGPAVFCAQSPVGGVCPMADVTRDEAVVAPDGDAVFGNRMFSSDPDAPKTVQRNGAASWRFFWTAPKAGTGPLTVYVAAVDGNGGAGTAANDQDPYDDDTVAANFYFQEANAAARSGAAAGCSVIPTGRPTTTGPLALLLLLAPLVIYRSAARRAVSCSRIPAAVSSASTSASKKASSLSHWRTETRWCSSSSSACEKRVASSSYPTAAANRINRSQPSRSASSTVKSA
jgi:hypothetical protein